MDRYEWKFTDKNEWDTFGLWTGPVKTRICMWFSVITISSFFVAIIWHANWVLSHVPGAK